MQIELINPAILKEYNHYLHLRDTTGFVYAPTETDIIQEMQNDCRDVFRWAILPRIGENRWECSCFRAGVGRWNEYLGETAIDACYTAYIAHAAVLAKNREITL